MANERFDIVIAGGGGMGSALAYFLKVMGSDGLRIAVCEPDPTYARAATALAAGGIRQQFSTPENILMSQFGFDFMSRSRELLAVGDAEQDVGLHALPYLHLAAGDADVEALKESHDLQLSLGGAPRWLDHDALRAAYPWMALDDVEAAVLGGPGEGLFDPYALVQAFRRKAISLGVEYRPFAAVGLDLAGGKRVDSVLLSDGVRLSTDLFVNAAGPWARQIAALANVELPVIPVRAHTFVFKAEKKPETALFPIVVDQIQLLNFRAEGDMFLAGSPREGELQDASDNFEIDYEFFDTMLWPMLATRVPVFEAIRMTNAWVGHMEWNVLDANPVIGPHPDITNMYFLNGFSGHGAQHCPAAGRGLAELILFNAYKTIDLARFGYERVLTGEPVIEKY